MSRLLLSLGQQFVSRLVRGLALVCPLSVLMLSGCQMAAHSQNSEGVHLFQQAYYEGALQRFQQAIQNDPSNADSYYNVASTYHQLAKLQQQKQYWEQSESYYHQCLDRNGDHQDCYRGLAVLLVEQNRSQDAFKLLEGWAARNPAKAAPKMELARLYEETGNREGATQQLIDAIALEPNNARVLAALGKLREDAGNSMQALANYERSLMVDRFQPEVAARVASLKNAFSPTAITTPPGGTRTVTAPSPITRF